MGKKGKIGKARKDKFYKLAKETGYRARSAFKLLQLNRKYEFLQKSRVCIDLCAAPGGWLQVAANQMPVSSLIIGVDLVPIKAIHGVITHTEDITTEKCRSTLRKELKDWKADVVLNDGAPNVGKSWTHDAFQQAELTLHALKLATFFLRKGGWFVTKVFRSQDYNALMWVFGQLFGKVHATKPQASRNESAEIFVVCQNYSAPDKLDPKFLDPKHVFQETNFTGKVQLNLVHPEKRNRQREGYADGDYTLHHKLPVSQFFSSESHLEELAVCNQIVLDDKEIADHPLTTPEIVECLKDIKVLGKKEIRTLLAWRKKVKAALAEKKKGGKNQKAVETIEAGSDDEDEDIKLQKRLSELTEEQRLEERRKKKKVMKEKRKLRDKMSLKMIIPGDRIETSDDLTLFSLSNIKKKQHLSEIESQDMECGIHLSDGSDNEDAPKANYKFYDRYEKDEEENKEEESSEEEYFTDADEEDLEMESDDEKEDNPLMVDLESKQSKAASRADMWFNKDVFSGLENDEDEDLEIERMTKDYKERGGTILDNKKSKKKEVEAKKKQVDAKKKQAQAKKAKVVEEQESGDDSDSGHVSESEDEEPVQEVRGQDDDDEEDSDSDGSSSDSDYDTNTVLQRTLDEKVREKRTKSSDSSKKDGFEIVHESEGDIKKLDPLGLAIGTELIKSRKRRREIEELSFNRYTFNDDNLPDWFVADEKKHCKRMMPVTKQMIQDQKDRMKSIDARPIKKVAEAKARKKRKMAVKLEKARKKAEAISDNLEVSDKEKMAQMKQVYKKAGLLKKKKTNVEYVVAKKGVGKRVRRPAGVKGHFKVVDPRMKSDDRKRKTEIKRGGKGGKRNAGKGGRKGKR